MSTSGRHAGEYFLVAEDGDYRFDDSPVICDGLGAFIYRVTDTALAESLIELYKTECPDREFDLVVMAADSLTAHQLVLVNREISHGESIGVNLESDDYRTSAPNFAAISRCAATLGRLEDELGHVLEDSARAKVTEVGDEAYSVRHRLFPPLTKPQSLQEAFDRLTYVLERHRLLFLHIARAVRRNPSAIGGPTGIYERVPREEMLGHKQYIEQVDSDGEFLFKNRWFLDRYADEAISRFGPGEGTKPDVEGATHPYWSLDETSAGYLQESADLIHACAVWLRSFDTRTDCNHLVNRCLGIAYDQGKSRWYSSILTRWQYLPELDEAIAAVKRGAVLFHRLGQSETERPGSEAAWYYLRVKYDEATFNHDPDTLGRVVGDPNYYPLDRGTLTFFKVQGEVLAQRLVRLFDRAVKPNVERDDETRVGVSFSCQRVDAIDEDDVFLIEEEVASARAEVERLDQQWNSQVASTSRTGSAGIQRRRPLSGELLSYQRLFDQAQRWAERLGGTAAASPEAAERSEEPPSTDEDTTPSEESASDDLLRVQLPIAVMAAAGLRDLLRIRYYYPNVIPEEEAKSLHEEFATNLRSAAEACKLDRVFEIGKIPSFDEGGSDDKLSVVMGVLAVWHPDTKGESSATDLSEILDAAMTKCQEDVTEPVRSMIERVMIAMIYDCRVPMPGDDPSFEEPQRFLQMLRSYWTVFRQLVLHHIEAPASLCPHPLMPLVVNLQARMDACFDKLTQLADDGADVRQQVATLVDIVLSGQPDDLQAAPEWSYDQVQSVDRFIEEGRLTLGAKTYPLTPAEEMCLCHAKGAIQRYEEQVASQWSKTLKRMDAKREANSPPGAAPPEVTPPTETLASHVTPASGVQGEPEQFYGGEMVFLPDRVELCGVEICSGVRSKTGRAILNLLREKQEDEKFVAYSGEQLSNKLGLKEPAGAIRDLRDDIAESLMSKANIICGRQDVILSGGRGYRLSHCLSVQSADQLRGTVPEAITVPNQPQHGTVSGTVKSKIDDPVTGTVDPVTVRRRQLLSEVGKGEQLRAPALAKRLGCSLRTVKRDIDSLGDQIEFVGAARTGYYRLRQSPETDQ